MNKAYNHFCRPTSLRLAAIISAGISSAALAAPTLIDFEDLPAGTVVTNQYGLKGVLFQNNFLDTHVAPHSGTRVLRSASLSSEIFTPFPIVMTFTSPQATVKLFAASTGVALNGTLTAFDAGNNVVAANGPKLVAVDAFTTMFQVVDPDMTPSIVRAELSLENGIYFAIDDLEFDGQPPAPPPPTPPVVHITAPTNGAKVDITTLDIAGTVTGEGLLSTVKLTVAFPRPPEFANLPPFMSDLSLTGSGTTRQFSLQGFTGVPLGPISITVSAQNFAAQSGSDTVTITNLPIPIQTRFDAEGGFATFGDFNFGLIPGQCTVATYDRGAISVSDRRTDRFTPANVEIGDIFTLTITGEDGSTAAINITATAATVANVTAVLVATWNTSTNPLITPITATDETTALTLTVDTAAGRRFSLASSTTDGGGTNNQTLVEEDPFNCSQAVDIDAGATFVIRGDILTKWLNLRTLANPDGLGCPIAEERMTFEGDSTVQEFEKGRIYRSLSLPNRAAFVPAVFAKVFCERGEELKIGIPVRDPTESSGPASQTWLYQNFFHPERLDLLQSTMEIRGIPPILYIERQGGEWFGIGQLEPSAADVARGKTAATLWESFSCSDLQGPCTVGKDPDAPPEFPPPNSPDIGDTFCNSITYIPTLEHTCFVPPLFFCSPNFPCCIPQEWEPVRTDYTVTPVFGAIVSAYMTDIDNGFTHETHNATCPHIPDLGQAITTVTCVSDYEFFVRPIGPQIDTSPLPSLFGKKNTNGIKTEYEVAYAALAHNFLGAPSVGDLVHTTGRWIVDCGHSTYKTELHPIFSFARMKTVVSETNGFTGLEDDLGIGGKPATRIGIWVNGWYPGGEGNAIEFDAFPPPRPTPDARLHVIKPVDRIGGDSSYRAAEDVTMEFNFVPAGIANHVHLRFTASRRENTVTAAGEFKFQDHRQYWGIWYLYWGD